MRSRIMINIALSIFMILSGNALARISVETFTKPDPGRTSSSIPNIQIRVHKVGQINMTITNYGFFGSQMDNGITDPETGEIAPSCQYPSGSDLEYLFQGALWVGAIVNEDTLVSVGADGWQYVHEMYPAGIPGGDIIKRSTDPNNPSYDPDAVSDVDYIATYFDTLTDESYVNPDPTDNRPHIPLGLKIRQETYSWGDPEYSDFIIFKYIITNIGSNFLEDAYIGLYYDCDILHRYLTFEGYTDDISGHIFAYDSTSGDTLSIGWSADNDGDPAGDSWTPQSARDVFGVSLIDFPGSADISFNWWVSSGVNPSIYDWGPMLQENYRDFGTGGLGTPEGDKNKYYIISKGEFDYDQMFSAIDFSDQGWLSPPVYQFASDLADGYDTRFLFSFGSFDLMPSDSIEFAFVVAIGEGFHQNPSDYEDLFNADNPQIYYNTLSFDDLINNIITARSLYSDLNNFLCGDTNNDGEVNISDAVYLISYIFNGGPGPIVYETGDTNCDSSVDVSDVVYIINYVFNNGNTPCDTNGDGNSDC